MQSYENLKTNLSEFLRDHQGESDFVFEATAGRVLVRLALGHIDSLGCSFHKADCLLLETEAGLDGAKQAADKLSRQLNYLVEPIGIIETDPLGSSVQLRSDPPQREGDVRRYFELNAAADGLSLCRFEKAPGVSRQKIPAIVTRDVLSRLAADMAAAANEIS